MRILKTIKLVRPTFSTDSALHLSAPRSWAELTQDQLRYVLTLLNTFGSSVDTKVYLLCRFNGIRVHRRDKYGWKCSVRTAWWKVRRYFTIKTWQVLDLISQFDFIDSFESMNTRLVSINGYHAVDVRLHGVRFFDYLQAEKYYQIWQYQKDDAWIAKLACYLYVDYDGHHPSHMTLSQDETLSVIMWYSFVKFEMSKAFRHFFKKVDGDEVGEYNMMAAMNAQIRALTDGDITRESTIYDCDCWRALTELDAKAREANEYKKMMKKNGK